MKVAAHPLIVAAAFGLLGPAALDENLETAARDKAPCEDCDCSVACAEEGPSPTEFARVEAEWQAAVVRFDTEHSW